MARLAVPEGHGLYCSKSCAIKSWSSKERTADPVYSTRHSRVLKARGKAGDQACADCGQQAREWSQVHGTSGDDPEHYEPRCARCHHAYDGAQAKPGSRHHNAKLTEAQVLEMRASTGLTRKQLAAAYNVSPGTVDDILSGRRWKHVTVTQLTAAS
jgi:polyferredoxin